MSWLTSDSKLRKSSELQPNQQKVGLCLLPLTAVTIEVSSILFYALAPALRLVIFVLFVAWLNGGSYNLQYNCQDVFSGFSQSLVTLSMSLAICGFYGN